MASCSRAATELSEKKLYDAIEAYKNALIQAIEAAASDSSELTPSAEYVEKVATEKKFLVMRIEQFSELMHESRKKLESIFIQATSDLPALARTGRLALKPGAPAEPSP